MFGAKAEMAAIGKGIAWERVFVPFSIQLLNEPKSEVVRRAAVKAFVRFRVRCRSSSQRTESRLLERGRLVG